MHFSCSPDHSVLGEEDCPNCAQLVPNCPSLGKCWTLLQFCSSAEGFQSWSSGLGLLPAEQAQLVKAMVRTASICPLLMYFTIQPQPKQILAPLDPANASSPSSWLAT